MLTALLISAILIIFPIIAVQTSRITPSEEEIDPNLKPNLSTYGISPPSLRLACSLGASQKSLRLQNAHQATSCLRTAPQVDGEEKAGGLWKAPKAQRKPWEPPFPTRTASPRSEYRTLPPMDQTLPPSGPPLHSPDPLLSPKSYFHEPQVAPTATAVTEPVRVPTPQSIPTVQQPDPLPVPVSPKYSADQALVSSLNLPLENRDDTHTGVLSTSRSTSRRQSGNSIVNALKITALVLGVLVGIFAFAVLVAHCLAWFIVYKTEARLGEVRKGLLRGGEMKVCLCAR